MKLKSLLMVACLSVFSPLYAANQHLHPQADPQTDVVPKKNISWPGFCEIEVINSSYTDVRVYGVFDDGAVLSPFMIYSFESPHYISLYYYGYCHRAMDLYIDSWSGYPIYASYTLAGSTVRVVPYFAKQVKAEVEMRK